MRKNSKIEYLEWQLSMYKLFVVYLLVTKGFLIAALVMSVTRTSS